MNIKKIFFIYLFILFINNSGAIFILSDGSRVNENPEIVLNRLKKIINCQHYMLMEIYDLCFDNYQFEKAINIKYLNPETISMLEKSELSNNEIITCDTAKIILNCFKLHYCLCNRITLVHPMTGEDIKIETKQDVNSCIIL